MSVVENAYVVNHPSSPSSRYAPPPSAPNYSPPTTSNITPNTNVNSKTNSNPNPNIVPLFRWRRSPMRIQACSNCHQPTKTRTISSPNCITWCIVLVVFVFCWPLFWLPLVMDRCKKTNHVCGKCHTVIGEVRPLEGCCVKYKG